MKPINKLFVYWAGIGMDRMLAAAARTFFKTQPNSGTVYRGSNILIEFFEDFEDPQQRNQQPVSDSFIQCFVPFNSFAHKRSAQGEINILLRIETKDGRFLDCLLYRPSKENEFQITFEKGLDGSDPKRFEVAQEEKDLFREFLDPDIPYVEADQTSWRESVSTVVRHAMVHVFALDAYDSTESDRIINKPFSPLFKKRW